DIEDPPILINTERTHEENVQDDQMITQPTDVPSGNNNEVSRPITEPLVPDVTQEGMLTRSMAAKLIAASASECLFVNFLSEIEPKKVFEALLHQRWIDAMQDELNQFYRNKVSVQSKGITSNRCEKNTQSAKKQQSMAMSSAEAEYVDVAGCCAMPLQYPTIQYLTQEPSILILDIISSGIISLKEILNYTSSPLSIS
nr:retrovirus-related Pol polyprotein from transposon TNT 1-94 [Tanacetum cinerariifolium]